MDLKTNNYCLPQVWNYWASNIEFIVRIKLSSISHAIVIWSIWELNPTVFWTNPTSSLSLCLSGTFGANGMTQQTPQLRRSLSKWPGYDSLAQPRTAWSLIARSDQAIQPTVDVWCVSQFFFSFEDPVREKKRKKKRNLNPVGGFSRLLAEIKRTLGRNWEKNLIICDDSVYFQAVSFTNTENPNP